MPPDFAGSWVGVDELVAGQHVLVAGINLLTPSSSEAEEYGQRRTWINKGKRKDEIYIWEVIHCIVFKKKGGTPIH